MCIILWFRIQDTARWEAWDIKSLSRILIMSYDFRYVTRKEAVEVKKVLISLINDVQDEVRDNFTFSYHFIGSSARNMITEDEKSNIGFDFDVNI